jgi:hypothetical protein
VRVRGHGQSSSPAHLQAAPQSQPTDTDVSPRVATLGCILQCRDGELDQVPSMTPSHRGHSPGPKRKPSATSGCRGANATVARGNRHPLSLSVREKLDHNQWSPSGKEAEASNLEMWRSHPLDDAHPENGIGIFSRAMPNATPAKDFRFVSSGSCGYCRASFRSYPSHRSTLHASIVRARTTRPQTPSPRSPPPKSCNAFERPPLFHDVEDAAVEDPPGQAQRAAGPAGDSPAASAEAILDILGKAGTGKTRLTERRQRRDDATRCGTTAPADRTSGAVTG